MPPGCSVEPGDRESNPGPARRAGTPPARGVVASGVNVGAIVVTMAAALGGCASLPAGTPAQPVCRSAAASMRYDDAAPIRRLRVYTDPKTGDSAFEDTPLPPKRTPLLKTGKTLYEYDFGKGSKVQIVAAPGDLPLPLHPAPYRESFLVLEGSVTIELGDGTRRDLGPGDMTVFEDTDARLGHGGRTGHCGYVALNIVP